MTAQTITAHHPGKYWHAIDDSQIGADGKPKKDFTDLFSKIGIDLLKAGLSAAIASAAVAILLGVFVLVGVTIAIPVTLLVVGTLATAVFVGYLLDLADKKIAATLGEEDMTAYLSKKTHATTEYLGKKYPKEALYKDYHQLFVPAGQASTGAAK